MNLEWYNFISLGCFSKKLFNCVTIKINNNKNNKKLCSPRVFTAVLFIIIKKAETTQITIHWWKHKQSVVNPQTGILFCNKKEWSTNICYELDEPRQCWSLSRVWLFAIPGTLKARLFYVHGILQARMLEWVAISFSMGSYWPKDWTAGWFFIVPATREWGLTTNR